MNSASSLSLARLSGQRMVAALLGGLLFFTASPAFAQQDGASEATAAASAPVAEAVSSVPTAVAEVSAEAVQAEEKAQATSSLNEPPSNEEVLELLRSGNNGRPLTIAQMAAINDMIKRMEFMADIERKLQGIELGGGTTAANPAMGGGGAAPPVPGGVTAFGGDAGNAWVLRIIGSRGQYAAVLATGNQGTRIITVKQGDNTEVGRISRVSLDGVVLVSPEGQVRTLPFSTPAGTANLMTGR